MSSGRRDLGAWGAVGAGAGAATVATAATACCVPVLAPLMVAALGVSGAIWAARLEPYAVPILILAGTLVGFGFWTVYQPRPAAPGAACATRRPLALRWVLWGSAVVWIVALALNLVRWVPALAGR